MAYDASMVAEIVNRVMAECGVANDSQTVPVGISNRHIHLSAEHVEQLFGKG